MRKIRKVLRLKHDCALSGHQIAHSCQISRSTAADYLERFEKAALSWPLPEALSEEELVSVDHPLDLVGVGRLRQRQRE
jgi:hypothetical protein